MEICKDIVKCRDIRFIHSLSGADHAEKARQLLIDVPGIETMTIIRTDCLRVRYDVRKLTLQMLESALKSVGFDLDNSLTNRIKRSIFAYCEDVHRSSLHLDEVNHEHPSLTVPEHVTHDPRPDNWRNYV